MAALWKFIAATEAERTRFPDPHAARALAGEPVLPPNRLREVRRIATAEGVYYLKVFHRTQLKNRIRARLTSPRAGCDAEREAGATCALRGRGIAAPRPVAWGREGRRSWYLCAELPGAPLDGLVDGGRRAGLLRRAARFAGELVRSGVHAPDLSAEHLFVDGDAFAVLDLTNVTVARPGPPGARLLRRVLRRSARSLRGSALPRRAVLRAAVAFLRAGGCPPHRRRRILEGLPPWDTHGRYEVAGKSDAYRRRSPRRSAAELDLLRRVWPGRAGDTVLDCPCGAGRLQPVVQGELGGSWSGADRAAAMLQQAQRALGPGAPLVRADVRHLPFAGRAFDGVVLFRLLHHLPPEAARATVREATRVAGRFVVVTFFHPVSLHGLRRRLARVLRGRAATRHALRPARLRRWFAEEGFVPHRFAAQVPWLRDTWTAAFVRGGAR